MTSFTTITTPPAFRFSALPKDIRLMVYERLPITTRHIKVLLERGYDYNGSVTIVLRGLPLGILTVCWWIYHEAHAMFQAKIYALLAHPPRIIIPVPHVFSMATGFPQLLEVLQATCRIPSVLGLGPPARNTILYHTGNDPMDVNASVLRWLQQAYLYYHRAAFQPAWATLAAKTPPTSPDDTGLQILLSHVGEPCQLCGSLHGGLCSMLRSFGWAYFAGTEYYYSRVDISLLGSVVETGAELDDRRKGRQYTTATAILGRELDDAFLPGKMPGQYYSARRRDDRRGVMIANTKMLTYKHEAAEPPTVAIITRF
ncbi:hypothetical protein EJ02DRAFT_471454 [Clathrospora elynae]|uniref:Uncharacterized protein n=1 Tax=Clathrospora elynae TaxID=706981 RepID=A0A6A5S635_9PLEO|nr:hypothetical protein EJ02DRAFT_471454 [Clathrospora elynae]